MKKLFANIIPDQNGGFTVKVTLCNGERATFFFGSTEKTEQWLESRKARYQVFPYWLC